MWEPFALWRAVRAVGRDGLLARVGGLEAELDLTNDALGLADRQLVTLARAYHSPATVTHRTSSARRADRVLVMDARRCVAGTHTYLVAHSRMTRS